jgi:diguanylate cyclase (GGDEF)-like protein
VDKTRIWVNVAAISAWVLALAGMLALAWGTQAPSWTSGAAAAASVIAVTYAGLLMSQRLDPPPREFVKQYLAAVLAPVTWLAAASGGPGSPAVVALALGVRVIAGAEDIRTAISVAAGALVALTAIHYSVGGAIAFSDMLSGGVIFAAIALFPAWQVQRAQENAKRRRRASRAETTFGGGGERTNTPRAHEPMPSDLRRGIEVTRQEAEERRQTEVLTRYLCDVRDALGADEVVFWRWTGARDTLVAAACSGDGAEIEPTKFNHAEWLPLVKWSAEERIVHFDDGSPAPRIAMGPVAGLKRAFGALSISAEAGLKTSRDEMKAWVPRYTAQVAVLAELLETREEVGRQNRRTQALLRAAQQFQSNRTIESLGRSICETALEVTSASRGALVRWHPNSNDGEVQSVSDGHRIAEGSPISEDSQVGTMCKNGLPQVWEDARMIARHTRIYGAWETTRPIGSLGIIPLKREAGVIGAIVIEGDEPGDVLIAEVRNVRLLAAIAAVSLETMWEIEEVTRRARTDQLTGLANRRHFDEQITRVLAETDRFGGSASLVVADIDFFKAVNDTFGHDGGDAVLQSVAQAFQEGVRNVDTCARYGGEEIAVLLPQTSMDGARDFAERLRKAIESRVVVHGGREMSVTASFGVATYPDSVAAHDALFPTADRALYQAKAEGRNRVRCAIPSTVQKAT